MTPEKEAKIRELSAIETAARQKVEILGMMNRPLKAEDCIVADQNYQVARAAAFEAYANLKKEVETV